MKENATQLSTESSLVPKNAGQTQPADHQESWQGCLAHPMEEPFRGDCCCLWGRGSLCGPMLPGTDCQVAATCHHLLAQRTHTLCSQSLSSSLCAILSDLALSSTLEGVKFEDLLVQSRRDQDPGKKVERSVPGSCDHRESHAPKGTS